MKSLFIGSLVIGGALAALIYGVYFNQLSETQLVNLTVLWLFPSVFGAYGLLSIKLAQIVENGKASSIGAAIGPFMRFGILNIVILLLLLPLFLARTSKPIVAALIGSALWAVLLLIFFNVIFPSL